MRAFLLTRRNSLIIDKPPARLGDPVTWLTNRATTATTALPGAHRPAPPYLQHRQRCAHNRAVTVASTLSDRSRATKAQVVALVLLRGRRWCWRRGPAPRHLLARHLSGHQVLAGGAANAQACRRLLAGARWQGAPVHPRGPTPSVRSGARTQGPAGPARRSCKRHPPPRACKRHPPRARRQSVRATRRSHRRARPKTSWGPEAGEGKAGGRGAW